eukprot:302955_1
MTNVTTYKRLNLILTIVRGYNQNNLNVMSREKIELIDAALKKYYESLNAQYDSNFLNFCVDNDFEDEFMAQDIEEDPAESMLVDFDDNFPFAQPPDDRNSRILFVLKKLYHNPSFSFDKTFEFRRGFFSISEKDIQSYKDLCENQCPAIYNSAEGDTGFLKTLTIGWKNRFPYLLTLMSDYCVATVNADMKQMCVADWIKTSKHFINLKNLNVKTYEMIVAA